MKPSSLQLAMMREALKECAESSSRRTLLHRHPARFARAEVDRYTTIHTYFTALPREQHIRSTRPFSTRFRRLQKDPSEKDKVLSRPFDEEDNEELSQRRQPFHNYPRSLRELALRAREEEGNTQHRDREHRYFSRVEPDEAQNKSIEKITAESNKPSEKSTDESEYTLATSSLSRWTRPRPPSKEDLLRFAQGFWTRLQIRFKWFTIRGFRRFNADDFSAFFTLGGLGTVIFILVGTTTAVSLVFAAFNALNMQEWVARKIADHLTHETGVTVIFESAIVPKWKNSRICFQNVFISRRAHGHDADTLRKDREVVVAGVEDGSPKKKSRWKSAKKRMTALTAGQGMPWEGTHYNEYDEEEVAPPMSDQARGAIPAEDDLEGENNFSMFDLNVDSIDVKLNFNRWLDGKGLVEDAVVQGVRGIIDRRNVHWDPDVPYDPKEARRKRGSGGFELANLTISDFLVTVYQPGDFRPFNLSIFEAQVPRLRRQWTFYDLLSADRITGQVDGCLFSLHKPQSIGRTTGREREITAGRWKTLSRLRIDGINFDHIQNQSHIHGPISWILSGKFDVVADIKFPKDASSDIDINVIISEMLDNLSNAVAGDAQLREHIIREDGPIPGQHRLSGPAIEAPVTTVGPAAEGALRKRERELELLREENIAKRKNRSWRREMDHAATIVSAKRDAEADFFSSSELTSPEDRIAYEPSEMIEDEEEKTATAVWEVLNKQVGQEQADEALTTSANAASVVIDLDVRFKDIKAAVPLFASDLTYKTQTFVRPIVAFMNANQTLIPVHCRVMMDLSEFDGALDLAQTGLLPVISEKIYEALANHVSSQRANSQRIKSVSHWWLRMASDHLLQYAILIRDSLARSRSQPPGDTSSLSLQHGSTNVTGNHLYHR